MPRFRWVTLGGRADQQNAPIGSLFDRLLCPLGVSMVLHASWDHEPTRATYETLYSLQSDRTHGLFVHERAGTAVAFTFLAVGHFVVG